MRSFKFTRLGLFVALAGAAALAYVFVANRPIALPVAASEQNVAIKVYGLGTVEARILSKIGFEVGAELVELLVDDGDVVVAGQVLARLDQSAQAARVARARAATDAAAANLGKAEANVEKAAAVLAQRQSADTRQQELLGRNVMSRQVAEEAKRDVEVAAAELAVARTDVAVIKAEGADAKAALDYETTMLDQHLLKAPYDAVIVDRHVEAGTVVRAGDVIYTLMDPQSVWVLAYIDEERAGVLSVGQPAEIRLRSMPHEIYTGKVARIGIESDRLNEERRVWIACERCPPRSFLGEQAEVVITAAELPEALMVPEDAIAGFDGHQGRVFLIQDGKLASASLIFGHRTQDARVEVVRGLPEGARIVTAPTKGLAEGRAARAIEESRP